MATLAVIARAVLAGYYDWLFTAALTVVFAVLTRLFRNDRRWTRIIYRVFLGTAIFAIIVACINIIAVRVLGGPVTFQWLYYSQFLMSTTAQQAIEALYSWKQPAICATVCAIVVFFAAGLEKSFRRAHYVRIYVIGLIAILLYFPAARWFAINDNIDDLKLVNPVVTFAWSIWRAHHDPPLFSAATGVGTTDDPVDNKEPLGLVPWALRANPPKNVVLLVLESVSAEYLGLFGGSYPTTPNIDSAARDAALFSNIYAPVPATDEAVLSLLLGIYPPSTYQSVTSAHPDLVFPSISSELKKRGYRTAFFSSADLRFQHMDAFLSQRSFDHVEDYRTSGCERQLFVLSSQKWPFQDGSDDECLVDSITRWVTQAPREPFLAVMWTVMTHFPYATRKPPISWSKGADEIPEFNRYLTALYEDDETIGHLIRFLAESKLEKSTLVVITADHGEAFGQHSHFVHGGYINEEDIHVPLIFINPGMFHGEQFHEIGSSIDIPASILALLRVPVPEQWQGQSLFSTHARERTYFIANRDEYRVGFREGRYKFIFNAFSGKRELYDLQNDPNERKNLAASHLAFVEIAQKRLGVWVQSNNRFFRDVLQVRTAGSTGR